MKHRTFIGASLLAALASSLCCILPILFALTGAGIVGASAFFERWRPILLSATSLLLGCGFYFAYRKPRTACAPGSTCEKPVVKRTGRIWLWVSAAFVFLFAAFPYYSGPVASILLAAHDTPASELPRPAKVTRISLMVDGMTCASCAKSVETKLLELKGVSSVNVSYEKSRAVIEFDPGAITAQDLEKAIQEAGFKVRLS